MLLAEVSERIKQKLLKLEFEIIEEDLQRPWGGFFKINNSQADKFIANFISGFKPDNLSNISPKILIFKPNSRLSWQVHQRRTEIWQIQEGPVGVYLSKTDDQPEQSQIYQESQRVMIPSGTRHRNAKLNNWGVVAEIWVHTDPGNLSDENDIRRISDDYNRT